MADNEYIKQREEAVKTSMWAIGTFERIRPSLTDEDRQYIINLLKEDMGLPQEIRVRKRQGKYAKKEQGSA